MKLEMTRSEGPVVDYDWDLLGTLIARAVGVVVPVSWDPDGCQNI